MLKEKRMIPVQVTLCCDNCGAEMESDSVMYPTTMPGYPYKCPNCGETTTVYGQYYPYIKYIEDDATVGTSEYDKE